MLETVQQMDAEISRAELDLTSPIARLDIPNDIRDERDPMRQRAKWVGLINQRISQGVTPPVSATSVAVEDSHWQTMTLMISRRLAISEGRVGPAEERLMGDLRVRLATISGKPLAARRGGGHLHGVKIGQHPLGGKEANDLVRRGGSVDILRDYGAEFEVDLAEGVRLLNLYGWRLGRDAAAWWLYEVGGPLERELALWLAEQGQAERARAICPAAFGEAEPVADDEPAARRRGR